MRVGDLGAGLGAAAMGVAALVHEVQPRLADQLHEAPGHLRVEGVRRVRGRVRESGDSEGNDPLRL